MEKSEAAKVAKQMLPNLPGFVSNGGNVLLIAPIGNVLRALLFESSGYTKEDFHFSWFYMPICRPCSHLTLNHGERIHRANSNSGWRTDMPDLVEHLVTMARRKGVPELKRLGTSNAVIDDIMRQAGNRWPRDKHSLEEVSYLLILEGLFDSAERHLELLVQQEGDCSTNWERDIVSRGQSVLRTLKDDKGKAVKLIRQWQRDTIRNLKLERWG